MLAAKVRGGSYALPRNLFRLFHRHFGVEIKQFFQPFGIIFETTTNVDAFQYLIVLSVGIAQIGGHFFWVVQVGNCGGEMGFPCQQDVLGAAGEITYLHSKEARFLSGVLAKRELVLTTGLVGVDGCCITDRAEVGDSWGRRGRGPSPK